MTIRRIISRGGSFDSELGTPRREDNRSDLMLRVRIHLNRREPRGGADTGRLRDSGHNFQTVRWSDQQWREYQRNFERVCESVWNDALYLLPPASTPADVIREMTSQDVGASTDRPYLRCQLDVQIVNVARGSHATIQCHCLAESETRTFRSYIENGGGRDTGVMTNQDIYLEPAWDGANDLRFFNTVAHEVGHVLGLNHPICSGNADRCYGAAGTPERDSVMGFGSSITTRQASPWAARARQHTNVRSTWQPTTTQPNQPTIEELIQSM